MDSHNEKSTPEGSESLHEDGVHTEVTPSVQVEQRAAHKPKVWHDDRPRKVQRPQSGFIPIFDPPNAPRWRAWILIVLSVITLIVATALFERDSKALTQTAMADNVSIQARQAASLMSVEQEYNVLRHMRKLATTPSTTRRVATTWAALDRGDGVRTLIALSLMAQIPRQVAAGNPRGVPQDFDALLRRAFMYPAQISQDERALIETQIGLPARLLFVRDLPRGAPAKTQLYQEAGRITRWSILIVIVAMLAGLLGTVLVTRFWRGVRRGEVAFALPKSVAPSAIFLEAVAIYLGCFAFARVLGMMAGDVAWILSIVLQIGGSLLGICWPALRGIPLRVLARDVGIHRGDGLWMELRAGIVGYCAVLPFFAVGVVVMLALEMLLKTLGWHVPMPVHPDMVGLGRMSMAHRLLILLLAGVFAPVTEEIMFRGALFRGLRGRWRFWPAAWISALIFALIHPQGFLAIPPLVGLALGFAGLREWRDSLVAPMLAHGLHNVTLVLLLSVLLR